MDMNDTTDTTYTFGTSSYLWGLTWTPSSLADTAFRVKVIVLDKQGATLMSFNYITIKVYYAYETYLNYDGANLSLAGGTIEGGIIRSSSSGGRVEFISDSLRSYDQSSIKRIELEGQYLAFYDSVGERTGIIFNNGNNLQMQDSRGISLTGNMMMYDYTTDVACSFSADPDSGSNPLHTLGTSTYVWKSLYVNNVYSKSGTALNLYAPSSYIIANATIYPATNETYDLGTTSYQYNVVYTKQVNAQGANNLVLAADSNDIVCNVSIRPNDNNTHTCGTDATAWSTVYSYNYTDKCLWLDGEDDVELIKNMKPLEDDKGNIIL
jgi:hypothetical protein